MKRPARNRVPVSRIVLVGLPGAGKSTVGPLLARALGFRFVDADAAVEDAAGLDIPAIFRTRGEAGFRELERSAVDRIVRSEHVVVAPGGGWAAQPGTIESLPAGSVVIWLQVPAAEAARRLGREAARRPLLAGQDLLVSLARMEAERLRSYSAADIAVDTADRTPEAVAAQVATQVKSTYGIDGEAE